MSARQMETTEITEATETKSLGRAVTVSAGPLFRLGALGAARRLISDQRSTEEWLTTR